MKVKGPHKPKPHAVSGFSHAGDKGFVVSVCLYILFSWISHWVLVVIPWQWWNSPIGLLHIFFWNGVVATLCYCYRLAIITSPGGAPMDWKVFSEKNDGSLPTPADGFCNGFNNGELPDLHFAKPPQLSPAQISLFMEGKYNIKKIGGVAGPFEPRWCAICENFKPPRAHHCKELGTCVLKMDHYCPWVSNCVGYYNHKYFALFVFYAVVGLATLLGAVIGRLIIDASTQADNLKPLDMILSVFHISITLPVTICLTSLCFHQFSCIAEDCTNIELFAYEAMRRDYRYKKKNFVWVFDQGRQKNWQDFFGKETWKWFLPILPENIAKSDGMTFDTIPLEFDNEDPLILRNEESLSEDIIDLQTPADTFFRRKEKLELDDGELDTFV